MRVRCQVTGALRLCLGMGETNLNPSSEMDVKDNQLLLQLPSQEKYWNKNNIITGVLIFLSVDMHLYSACLKREI